MFMVFAFIFVLLTTFSLQNLILNGDFQSFASSTFTFSSVQLFQFFPSNLSQWYDKNLGLLEVKRRIDIQTSFCVDLSSTLPMTLCQNVSLKVGRRHQIKYDVYCEQRLEKMNYTVTVNGKIVSWVYVPSSYTFSTKTDYFSTPYDSEFNQICFSETHQPVSALSGMSYMIAVGGLLDNITLIEGFLHNIIFQVKYMQNQSKLYLISDLSFNQQIVDELFLQFSLKVGESEINNINVSSNILGYFEISAFMNLEFFTDEIYFHQINNPNANLFHQFNLKTRSDSFYYHNLTQSQIGELKIIQSYFYPFSKIALIIFNFIRYSTCSYLIITVLNFQNLSLFYVFLNLEILPDFTKLIYYDLLTIYFQVSSLTNWLNKTGLVPDSYLQIEAEKYSVREVMSQYLNKDRWFGFYKVSSLLINNNFDSYIILVLLVLKWVIVRLILKLMSKERVKKLKLKVGFREIFVVEVITCAPGFLPSAVARILNSNIAWSQRYQKMFQTVTVFLFLIIIPLHFQYKTRQIKRQRKQTPIASQVNTGERLTLKKRQYSTVQEGDLARPPDNDTKQGGSIEKTQMRRQKIHKENPKRGNIILYGISDFILLFTIPFLISFANALSFLIVHSVLMALKLAFFVCASSNKQWKQKIIEFCVNLVWITHHTIFTTLFIVGLQTEAIKDKQFGWQITALGRAAIITVVLGFFLQIVKSVLLIFEKIERVGVTLKNNCREKKLYPTSALKTEDGKKRSKCSVRTVKQLQIVDDRKESWINYHQN